MLDIRPMTIEDEPELKRVWSAVYESEFALLEGKLQKYLFDDSDWYPEASFSCYESGSEEMAGAIAVKISCNSLLYADTAWISFLFVQQKFQKQGLGSHLYRLAENRLREEGVKTIILGQEFQNFFSGIPAPNPEKDAFFAGLGFELNPDVHYDLSADIVENKSIDCFQTTDFEKIFTTDLIKKENYFDFLEFLHKEFPGRWEFEAENYLWRCEQPQIILLRKKSSGRIIGYCTLQTELRDYFGLGPIGIAEEVRGHRAGEYLLYQGLLQLRKLGAGSNCVNWTILKKFYGIFQFEPVRTYRSAVKEL